MELAALREALLAALLLVCLHAASAYHTGDLKDSKLSNSIWNNDWSRTLYQQRGQSPTGGFRKWIEKNTNLTRWKLTRKKPTGWAAKKKSSRNLRKAKKWLASEIGWTREDLKRMLGVPGGARRAADPRFQWAMRGAQRGFTSYSTTSSTSFGGGLSEFYGAGGSTSIARPNGAARTIFNTLYPGFGQTGEWILQPQDKLFQDPKPTGSLDINVLMSKLWASTILRDNMVTVFGYFINFPKNPLRTELYTSLVLLYDIIRFRRIQTVQLVPVLQEMAAASPTKQFLLLFQKMKKVVPKYMDSSVSVWIDALKNNDVDVSSIMRPNGGPVVVDFLAGIDSSVLDGLNEPTNFNYDTVKNALPSIADSMGQLFANVLSALSDRSLSLTQSLFALIMIHRPLNLMLPQREETERYLIDVLRLNNVEQWENIIKVVTKEDYKDPIKLIRVILTQLSTYEDIDPLIQEDARYVLQYVEEPLVTFVNAAYNLASPVVSKPTIDLLQLLKSIMPIEYPDEIIDLKTRIEYYILNGYLDIEFVIKGFNRFDHTKPVDVLIAILTRIHRRLPKLPHEIMSSVKYLKLYLIFKKFLCSMSPTVPTDLVDITSFVHAFDGPRVPKKVLILVRKLTVYLPYEEVSWTNLTKETPIEECSRPRQCILSIFKRVVKRGLLKGRPSLGLMIEFLKLLDKEGNPIMPNKEIHKFKGISQKPAAIGTNTKTTPSYREDTEFKDHTYTSPFYKPPSKSIEDICKSYGFVNVNLTQPKGTEETDSSTTETTTEFSTTYTGTLETEITTSETTSQYTSTQESTITEFSTSYSEVSIEQLNTTNIWHAESEITNIEFSSEEFIHSKATEESSTESTETVLSGSSESSVSEYSTEIQKDFSAIESNTGTTYEHMSSTTEYSTIHSSNSELSVNTTELLSTETEFTSTKRTNTDYSVIGTQESSESTEILSTYTTLPHIQESSRISEGYASEHSSTHSTTLSSETEEQLKTTTVISTETEFTNTGHTVTGSIYSEGTMMSSSETSTKSAIESTENTEQDTSFSSVYRSTYSSEIKEETGPTEIMNTESTTGHTSTAGKHSVSTVGTEDTIVSTETTASNTITLSEYTSPSKIEYESSSEIEYNETSDVWKENETKSYVTFDTSTISTVSGTVTISEISTPTSEVTIKSTEGIHIPHEKFKSTTEAVTNETSTTTWILSTLSTAINTILSTGTAYISSPTPLDTAKTSADIFSTQTTERASTKYEAEYPSSESKLPTISKSHYTAPITTQPTYQLNMSVEEEYNATMEIYTPSLTSTRLPVTTEETYEAHTSSKLREVSTSTRPSEEMKDVQDQTATTTPTAQTYPSSSKELSTTFPTSVVITLSTHVPQTQETMTTYTSSGTFSQTSLGHARLNKTEEVSTYTTYLRPTQGSTITKPTYTATGHTAVPTTHIPKTEYVSSTAGSSSTIVDTETPQNSTVSTSWASENFSIFENVSFSIGLSTIPRLSTSSSLHTPSETESVSSYTETTGETHSSTVYPTVSRLQETTSKTERNATTTTKLYTRSTMTPSTLKSLHEQNGTVSTESLPAQTGGETTETMYTASQIVIQPRNRTYATESSTSHASTASPSVATGTNTKVHSTNSAGMTMTGSTISEQMENTGINETTYSTAQSVAFNETYSEMLNISIYSELSTMYPQGTTYTSTSRTINTPQFVVESNWTQAVVVNNSLSIEMTSMPKLTAEYSSTLSFTPNTSETESTYAKTTGETTTTYKTGIEQSEATSVRSSIESTSYSSTEKTGQKYTTVASTPSVLHGVQEENRTSSKWPTVTYSTAETGETTYSTQQASSYASEIASVYSGSSKQEQKYSGTMETITQGSVETSGTVTSETSYSTLSSEMSRIPKLTTGSTHTSSFTPKTTKEETSGETRSSISIHTSATNVETTSGGFTAQTTGYASTQTSKREVSGGATTTEQYETSTSGKKGKTARIHGVDTSTAPVATGKFSSVETTETTPSVTLVSELNLTSSESTNFSISVESSSIYTQASQYPSTIETNITASEETSGTVTSRTTHSTSSIGISAVATGSTSASSFVSAAKIEEETESSYGETTGETITTYTTGSGKSETASVRSSRESTSYSSTERTEHEYTTPGVLHGVQEENRTSSKRPTVTYSTADTGETTISTQQSSYSASIYASVSVESSSNYSQEHPSTMERITQQSVETTETSGETRSSISMATNEEYNETTSGRYTIQTTGYTAFQSTNQGEMYITEKYETSTGSKTGKTVTIPGVDVSTARVETSVLTTLNEVNKTESTTETTETTNSTLKSIENGEISTEVVNTSVEFSPNYSLYSKGTEIYKETSSTHASTDTTESTYSASGGIGSTSKLEISTETTSSSNLTYSESTNFSISVESSSIYTQASQYPSTFETNITPSEETSGTVTSRTTHSTSSVGISELATGSTSASSFVSAAKIEEETESSYGETTGETITTYTTGSGKSETASVRSSIESTSYSSTERTEHEYTTPGVLHGVQEENRTSSKRPTVTYSTADTGETTISTQQSSYSASIYASVSVESSSNYSQEHPSTMERITQQSVETTETSGETRSSISMATNEEYNETTSGRYTIQTTGYTAFQSTNQGEMYITEKYETSTGSKTGKTVTIPGVDVSTARVETSVLTTLNEVNKTESTTETTETTNSTLKSIENGEISTEVVNTSVEFSPNYSLYSKGTEIYKETSSTHASTDTTESTYSASGGIGSTSKLEISTETTSSSNLTYSESTNFSISVESSSIEAHESQYPSTFETNITPSEETSGTVTSRTTHSTSSIEISELATGSTSASSFVSAAKIEEETESSYGETTGETITTYTTGSGKSETASVRSSIESTSYSSTERTEHEYTTPGVLHGVQEENRTSSKRPTVTYSTAETGETTISTQQSSYSASIYAPVSVESSSNYTEEYPSTMERITQQAISTQQSSYSEYPSASVSVESSSKYTQKSQYESTLDTITPGSTSTVTSETTVIKTESAPTTESTETTNSTLKSIENGEISTDVVNTSVEFSSNYSFYSQSTGVHEETSTDTTESAYSESGGIGSTSTLDISTETSSKPSTYVTRYTQSQLPHSEIETESMVSTGHTWAEFSPRTRAVVPQTKKYTVSVATLPTTSMSQYEETSTLSWWDIVRPNTSAGASAASEYSFPLISATSEAAWFGVTRGKGAYGVPPVGVETLPTEYGSTTVSGLTTQSVYAPLVIKPTKPAPLEKKTAPPDYRHRKDCRGVESGMHVCLEETRVQEFIYEGPHSQPYNGYPIYPPDFLGSSGFFIQGNFIFTGQIVQYGQPMTPGGTYGIPKELLLQILKQYQQQTMIQNINITGSSTGMFGYPTQINIQNINIENIQQNIININVPLPVMNPLVQHEPASLAHPETLLPVTQVGTVEDIKLRPLRFFLANPNLFKLLGPTFRAEYYIKKGTLLRAILEHALTLQIVRTDIVLMSTMEQYLQVMDLEVKQPNRPQIVVSFSTLVNALPYPRNEDEASIIGMVRAYISQPDLYKSMNHLVNAVKYNTKGLMLKHVLQISLNLTTVKSDTLLFNSIKQVINRVYLDGYGAQAVEWVLVQQHAGQTNIDVYSLFSTLDHKKLKRNTKAMDSLKKVVHFVVHDFDSSVYFDGFDVTKYKTKGTLLHGSFMFLMKQNAISPKLKESITLLLPYIKFTGIGATPIEDELD